MTEEAQPGLLGRLRERGVLRVAASYAVISWLALQIADVTLEPLGLPKWVMTALIVAAAVGLPVAIALAWFLEIGEQGVEVDRASAGVTRPSTHGLRHYADAIVIGVLLIAVVILLVRQSDIGKPKPPENPAIAVLPFENLSGDPEQEYFSDGLAEETLDRLGRVPGLRVIARSSSFGFKGKDVDAKTIAEKLGVTTLLEGSVRRDGKRLKLNARLIDGATGQQVWSGSFDRELQDIFAVQAELASAIVHAIVPAARGEFENDARPDTTNLDAYDLFLLARTELAIRTQASIEKSLQLMEQAVEIDPSFARAHALLAAALLFRRLLFEGADSAQADALRRRAETEIHRALALDPNLSEAYDAQGNLLRDTSQPGAEDAYKRAIELNPSNAAAWHDYAVFLGSQDGREAESLRATERALELDPRQPVTWANYVNNAAIQGREKYEQALARAVRMVGDMPGAMNRFAQPIFAGDRESYRKEFTARLESAARYGALDGMTLPAAAIPGFPVEIMKAGLLKRPPPTGDELPAWFYPFRAWLPVDARRAEAVVPDQVEPTSFVDRGRVRLLLLADAIGLQRDWPKLDRHFDELLAYAGPDDPQVRSIMAFWLEVQGRHDEAARSLALAGQVPASRMPPVLGSDVLWGQMETAQIRIYRATGRKNEARQLADQRLAALREEWSKGRSTCQWEGWMNAPLRYPSLAANEGLRKEATTALQDALRCGDLPFGFDPHLPWFEGLQGYPPYDELVAEYRLRVERIRTELLQLEASAGIAHSK